MLQIVLRLNQVTLNVFLYFYTVSILNLFLYYYIEMASAVIVMATLHCTMLLNQLLMEPVE